MLRENENPPVVWPEEKELRDFIGEWWVAHTKSRNEKALAQNLVSKNICYFLPMNWHIRHAKNRKTRSLLPLFSGYLFFCGNEKQRIEVLQTNRVANLIEVKNQEKLIKELTQIEQALKAGENLKVHEYIKTGQNCRIKSGALAGMEGFVVKTKNIARLILQVDMLGQSASIEVDTDIIETID